MTYEKVLLCNEGYTLYSFHIGYLCGGCHGDKGFSVLLNNYVSCGNVNVLLLLTLSKSWTIQC